MLGNHCQSHCNGSVGARTLCDYAKGNVITTLAADNLTYIRSYNSTKQISRLKSKLVNVQGRAVGPMHSSIPTQNAQS
jgi:hypothetical protein